MPEDSAFHDAELAAKVLEFVQLGRTVAPVLETLNPKP